MNRLLVYLFIACATVVTSYAQDKVLNILAIGAHPDDCDLKFGGTAALYVKMGHKVKFLSIANGDAGHMEQGGGMLARRRFLETQEAAKKLGVVYEVLDYHDGEIMPTMDLRNEIIRQIREWNADIVISHRTNDYHPDHRYAGTVVQDAAFLVEVPNIAPSSPALRKTPLFLFFKDHFQTPLPFSPDIAIDISSVMKDKIDALDSYVSQFYEWLPWVSRYNVEIPTDNAARKEWLLNLVLKHSRWTPVITPEIQTSLENLYGKSKASTIKYAEAFEICEYGRQPSGEEVLQLFPMIRK